MCFSVWATSEGQMQGCTFQPQAEYLRLVCSHLLTINLRTTQSAAAVASVQLSTVASHTALVSSLRTRSVKLKLF